MTDQSLSPDTTAEQDLKTFGQRRINLIWEATQASIAVIVVLANVIAAFIASAQANMLANAFFLVIGFYFGRTNHARIGDSPQSLRTER